MFEHGIEDGEEFAHAGGEHELLGFASGDQTAIEGVEDLTMAHRRLRKHVERSAPLLAPVPHLRLPPIIPLSRLKGASPTKGRALTAIPLRHYHPDQLAPTSAQRLERAALRIGQWPHLGLHPLGVQRDYLRVERIGLGQHSRATRKAAGY